MTIGPVREFEMPSSIRGVLVGTEMCLRARIVSLPWYETGPLFLSLGRFIGIVKPSSRRGTQPHGAEIQR